MKKRMLGILLSVCCVAGMTLMGCQESEEPMTEEEIYGAKYHEVMDNYEEEVVSYAVDAQLELPFAKARQLDNRSDFRKGLMIQLDTLELTPLTLVINGSCEYDRATEKLDGMNLYIERLTYMDGTTVEAVVGVPEEEGGALSVSNAIIYELDEYSTRIISENETRILFEQEIEPENVKSITINGVEFPLTGGA